MLKVRVIPTLLWKNVTLVKGVSFDSWRRVGTLMPAVKVYNTREVDELAVFDIRATQEGRSPDYHAIAEVARECFVPLMVGGGITTIEDIRRLLLSGADKVCINSAAYPTPQLITEAANKFGSQCIVVAIDAKLVDRKWLCFSHNGSRPTEKQVGKWAREVEELGAGEILITSILKDGTMEGYELDLILEVSKNVTIPVIASGGAGNYEHMFQALEMGKASAVAAASIFHFTEATPLEAKHYLAQKGVAVRNAKIWEPDGVPIG